MPKTLEEIAAMPVGLEACIELKIAYMVDYRIIDRPGFQRLIIGPLGKYLRNLHPTEAKQLDAIAKAPSKEEGRIAKEKERVYLSYYYSTERGWEVKITKALVHREHTRYAAPFNCPECLRDPRTFFGPVLPPF